MKKFPLAVQIWMLCAGITLCVFILIAALLPGMLQDFFTQQIFGLIQDSQKNLMVAKVVTGGVNVKAPSEEAVCVVQADMKDAPQVTIKFAPAEPSLELPPPEQPVLGGPDVILFKPAVRTVGQAFPVVQHIVLSDDGPDAGSPLVPEPFLRAVEEDAQVQQVEVQNYSREIDEKTLFYVIRKEQVGEQPGYVVSYSWGNYRNDLVASMYTRLLLLMVILMVLSWPPSLWLARYLTRPLVEMEAQATRISERDWHEPLNLDRGDEIGRLARAFENMRQRLARQDEAQRKFFQNVSHELKTPVMVISSYAQSILDGIFPRGSVEESVKVISGEAERLEKRVRGLLHLNKLSYLNSREKSFEVFDMAEVMRECVERFRWRRPEIDWEVSCEPVKVLGDKELWGVAVENLFDNQARFARRRIVVSSRLEEGVPGSDSVPSCAVIRIWNDGPPIEDKIIGSLFDPYQTGQGGEFGLGLAIVKQIADLHGSEVWAENEADGVGFYISVRMA